MSQLKTIKLPFSANIKLALVLLALLIVGGTLLYTQALVERLKASERRTITFFAKSLLNLQNTEQSAVDASAFMYDLVNVIHFPMIITDKDLMPQLEIGRNGDTSYTTWTKNVDVDSTAPPEQQKREVREKILEMAATYTPLPIYDLSTPDSVIINYVVYDDSSLIEQVRWLPYAEILIGAMFIVVGYLSFSHIKRNEQSNIWVGMAKETAHQLGTPLSSLLGWIELLRLMPEDTTQVMEAADEMEQDVQRLNKVAQRFSKIGSAAELKTVEMNRVISNVIGYFERRLPHLGKTVTLTMEESEPVYVAINVDLFEWVFENMVRNAADAIDRPDGRITFHVRQIRGEAMIDIIDNGRGIDPKIRKDIFRPGFSTKTRGWGLGLSLAKRIVEEYHGGKIVVKESSSEGTTFRIRLNAVTPSQEPAPRNGTARAARDVEAQEDRRGSA